MKERVSRSRRSGRTPIAKGDQVLSRTASQLLRRISRAARDGTSNWAEPNTVVAKALHVDRSTIVRAVAKFCDTGILHPIETKGGRGRVSRYRMDLVAAQEALRTGRWPEAVGNRRSEPAPEGAQDVAHPEKEVHRTRRFAETTSTTSAHGSARPHPRGEGVDAPAEGHPFSGDGSPLLVEKLLAQIGSAGAPCLGLRTGGWGDRQPDRFRRAVTAGILEGGWWHSSVSSAGGAGRRSWRPLPRRWLWPTHSQKEGGHPGSWPSISKNRGRSHLDLRTPGSTLSWQHSHADHRPTADRYSPSPRSVSGGSSADRLPLRRDRRPGCLGCPVP